MSKLYDILAKMYIVAVLALAFPVLFVSESTAGNGGELTVPNDIKIQFGETKRKDKESRSKAGHGGKLSFDLAHGDDGAVTSYDGRTLTINPEAEIGAETTITVTEAAKGENAKQEKSFKVQIVPRPIYANMRGMYVVGNLPEWGRHWNYNGEDRTYGNFMSKKFLANGLRFKIEEGAVFWYDLPVGAQLDTIAGPAPSGLTHTQRLVSLSRFQCELPTAATESYNKFGVFVEVFQAKNFNAIDGDQFMLVLVSDQQYDPDNNVCGQEIGNLNTRYFIVQKSGLNSNVWSRKQKTYHIWQNDKYLPWRP